MKMSNKHWLQEVGTREGNRLIFSRPWTPSYATDIRETFQRIKDDEAWVAHMERTANYEALRGDDWNN